MALNLKICLMLVGLLAVFEVDGVKRNPCNLPPATGPCRGSFPMYYYDSKTKQCERFIYGGCGGNANRFYTIEECDRTCGTCSLPKDTGPCKAYIPRYYYNSETGKCETFIYGGCGGNGNRFKTLEECEQECG